MCYTDDNDSENPSSSGSKTRTISLYRDASGSLGFSVLGRRNQPFTIANIQPDSPAAAANQNLKVHLIDHNT